MLTIKNPFRVFGLLSGGAEILICLFQLIFAQSYYLSVPENTDAFLWAIIFIAVVSLGISHWRVTDSGTLFLIVSVATVVWFRSDARFLVSLLPAPILAGVFLHVSHWYSKSLPPD